MQVIKSVLGMFEEVGKEECTECGHVYKLYQTPVGVKGSCKPCSDRQVFKDFNLPTSKEYKEAKELNFILSFERVTDDLKNVTVNGYQPKHESQLRAKQTAAKYVKEFDGTKTLAFSGEPGLGKSHLAYAMVKGVRSKRYFDKKTQKEKPYKAMFIKTTDLLMKIKGTYNYQSNLTEERIMKLIDELDLLALDDLGSEYVKPSENGQETWASDILFRVIDMRLGKGLITTTNYSESSLKEKLGINGDRIVDRLLDNAQAIRLEGESYRRKGF
ncbi:ATP-binding protein [Gracilibacillus sp. YIM 98692]|uniref:ATP-binding protein n=1 Tax=Gracilibacillus sp. YIM 98692 TaxID=2663532 RepID=UPI0013D12E88|nr:ATP-binding protein [Gracilibacillus sp. YIM 98692]